MRFVFRVLDGEYGNASLQDKWCAPELGGGRSYATRKERAVADLLHRQDQSSCKEGLLDPLSGGYLKTAGNKGRRCR